MLSQSRITLVEASHDFGIEGLDFLACWDKALLLARHVFRFLLDVLLLNRHRFSGPHQLSFSSYCPVDYLALVFLAVT